MTPTHLMTYAEKCKSTKKQKGQQHVQPPKQRTKTPPKQGTKTPENVKSHPHKF